MAAGNFDELLFISAGAVQSTQGPMTFDPNELPLWIESWVVQAHTGAAQSFTGMTFPGNTRWVAGNNHYRRGNFAPGPAVGTALLWAQVTTPTAGPFPTHFLWTDEIQLR